MQSLKLDISKSNTTNNEYNKVIYSSISNLTDWFGQSVNMSLNNANKTNQNIIESHNSIMSKFSGI